MGSGRAKKLPLPILIFRVLQFRILKSAATMASGRVGGTKSKVSGTIGSEYTSLRRNPDGTYSQVVSG